MPAASVRMRCVIVAMLAAVAMVVTMVVAVAVIVTVAVIVSVTVIMAVPVITGGSLRRDRLFIRMCMLIAMAVIVAAASVMVMSMARVRILSVPVFGGNDRWEFAVHGRYSTPWGYYRVKRCLATRHPRRLEYENR